MKTKKLSKKLRLNKKTVANLNNYEMSLLKGGLKWESDIEPTECCATPQCTQSCSIIYINGICQ